MFFNSFRYIGSKPVLSMTTNVKKPAAKPAPKPKLRKLGELKGKIYIAPDAFTPGEMREPGYLEKSRKKK